MSIENIIVLIKGGGEMATGVAHRLNRCHFKVCMTEISHPQAVRREVSFCEAVYDREKTVEGLTARLVDSYDRIPDLWDTGKIPIIVDPEAKVKDFLKPAIVVDAILAKKNVGTKITDAPLVIGLDQASMLAEMCIWWWRPTEAITWEGLYPREQRRRIRASLG